MLEIAALLQSSSAAARGTTARRCCGICSPAQSEKREACTQSEQREPPATARNCAPSCIMYAQKNLCAHANRAAFTLSVQLDVSVSAHGFSPSTL